MAKAEIVLGSGNTNIDISDIVNVEMPIYVLPSMKPAIYTVGINTLNVKNPHTGYNLNVCSDSAGSNTIATIGHNTNLDVDVSEYNVVYLKCGTNLSPTLKVIN